MELRSLLHLCLVLVIVVVRSWFNDQSDTQLLQILPVLDAMADSDDITQIVANLHVYQNQNPGLLTPTPPHAQDDDDDHA